MMRLQIMFLPLLLGMSGAAQQAPAPDTPPLSLAEQLRQDYKLGKSGTILAVQQAGLLGAPGPLIIPTAHFQGGELHSPKKILFPKAKDIATGEKVFPLKLGIDLKKNTVSFEVVEYDEPNYRVAVNFVFPPDFLSTAQAWQIEETVSKVLAFDRSASQVSAQQPTDEQASSQAAPAAQSAPPSVKEGQTTEEVVSILGQPERTAQAANKVIYFYKDLKITFVNGKVSDIQ